MADSLLSDSVGKGIPWTSIGWILLIILIVTLVAQLYIGNLPLLRLQSMTMAQKAADKEGFFGGVARGAGHPDCLRNLNEGPELLDIVRSAAGTADYSELQLILSKLGCLKQDIMGPSGIVEATRYQAYEAAHDREPIAEVAATCLNSTISKRDLDIIFVTFKDRAKVLLRRLCTIANISEAQTAKADKLLLFAWKDVYEIASGRCIATPGELEAQAHDAQPFEPPAIQELREYNGYYSGWTGQI
jgi:hypothetical protein